MGEGFHEAVPNSSLHSFEGDTWLLQQQILQKWGEYNKFDFGDEQSTGEHGDLLRACIATEQGAGAMAALHKIMDTAVIEDTALYEALCAYTQDNAALEPPAELEEKLRPLLKLLNDKTGRTLH